MTITDDTFYICFKLSKHFACIIYPHPAVVILHLSCLAKYRIEKPWCIFI